jgi:hypothetical protein
MLLPGERARVASVRFSPPVPELLEVVSSHDEVALPPPQIRHSSYGTAAPEADHTSAQSFTPSFRN